MRLLPIAAIVFLLAAACQNSKSRLSATNSSADVDDLWAAYVKAETTGADIQDDCQPRIYKADTNSPKQGMVMFFHGFTACPQQYFDIAERLSQKGFDVYLPLLPGHGRRPTYEGHAEYQEKDNLGDLPTTANSSEYRKNPGNENDRHEAFVATMNQIAWASSAEIKVIAGLSGGGSLATGAAITGQDIWDRALVYAPYYKNPGISGPASAILGAIMPGFLNDWGDKCRQVRSVGRAGYCSVPVGAVRAMTNYGIWAAQNIHTVDMPIQMVGVDHDPTADNWAINKAYEDAPNAQLCLYYEGVPHSIINPKDDEPSLDPRWVPAMQQDSINFITEGTWFPTDGMSSEKYDLGACRI
jgi:pimeloyl-ACP methyl ester carboxylesterase